MNFQNSINVFCSKRPWIQRFFKSHLADVAWVNIHEKLICYFDPNDIDGQSRYIARQAAQGFYQYQEVAKNEVLKILKPDGVFIDIGADIGLFGLYIAEKRSDVRVISYEPNPITQRCLNHSIFRNGFTNMTLKPSAVGPSEDFSVQHSSGSLELPKFDPAELRVDFIKITVGQNCSVALENSLEVIKKHRPHLLIRCDHSQVAQKQEAYHFFQRHFLDEVVVRVPGTKTEFGFEQFKNLSRQKLAFGLTKDNYLFRFT